MNNNFVHPLTRTYKISVNLCGLSDPFKFKNDKSNKDVQDFIKEKQKSLSPTYGNPNIEDNKNILAKIVKMIVNPVPINIRLREKFGIDESYRLIYLIENERSNLVIYSLINVLFPLILAFISLFSYAEMTGASQMHKSFDNPYLFVGTLTIYVCFIYFLARKTQSFNIMRIYYNETKNEFISFRQTGILAKYQRDTFTAKDVVFRFDPEIINQQNRFFYLLTRQFGNVYIKNQLRLINFKQFSSDTVLEKMVGRKNMELIKKKSD